MLVVLVAIGACAGEAQAQDVVIDPDHLSAGLACRLDRARQRGARHRPGAKMKKGRTVRRHERFVYVVRHRRVKAVAVTRAKRRNVIRRQLKTAGLL